MTITLDQMDGLREPSYSRNNCPNNSTKKKKSKCHHQIQTYGSRVIAESEWLLDFDKQGIVLPKINNFASIFSLWHSFPRPLGSDVLPRFLNNINYHIIWLGWNPSISSGRSNATLPLQHEQWERQRASCYDWMGINFLLIDISFELLLT